MQKQDYHVKTTPTLSMIEWKDYKCYAGILRRNKKSNSHQQIKRVANIREWKKEKTKSFQVVKFQIY